jgi:hypothetical protein
VREPSANRADQASHPEFILPNPIPAAFRRAPAMRRSDRPVHDAHCQPEEYLLFYKTLSRRLRSGQWIAKVLHKNILRSSIKPLPTDKVFRDNPRRSHYWAQGQYKLF